MTAVGRLGGGLCVVWLAVLLVAPVAAAAAGRPLDLVSVDGTPLAAVFYESAARPAAAVVLVHMYGRSAGDWDDLANRLQRMGVSALAVDLRGHGRSSGPSAPSRAMTDDVRAAVAWMAARPGVRPGALAIVGASLGANLALLAAIEEPEVRGVALLSPSLDYRGVRVDPAAMRQLGGRPALLVASVHDPYAVRTVRDLLADDAGPREQWLSDATAHGMGLLSADAEVGPTLVDWLRRTLVF